MANGWDVVVVGAGPGGSSAAYGLARAGARVILLEKERIPRYKPCGGALTAKVRTALDFDIAPAIEDTITAVSVAYGSRRQRIPAEGAWCVMRDRFDALLAERAAAAGAALRDGEAVARVTFEESRVQVTTARGEMLRSAWVVGADGANGLVRRAAGLARHHRMAAALEAEMDASPAALDEWRGTLHLDFGAIPWGYAWIFPKAEHLSIGIGDLVRDGRRVDLRARLAEYVSSEPSLHGAQGRLTQGHLIPLGGELGRYHSGRALLVGDAAGVVDPFTAEGIYYAIRSGQIAAEELVRALEAGECDLSTYTERVNAEISSDMRYAWMLTQLFYRAPLLGYSIFVRSVKAGNAAVVVAQRAGAYQQMIWGILRNLARSLGR